MYLFGQTIELHIDFDLSLDGRMEASRLHAPVKSKPVCGDHSAQKGTLRAIQSQIFARNPTLVDFGALRTP